MARTSAYRPGNTVGQHDFAQAPRALPPRSVFNRSCGHKTTFDSGQLIPFFLDQEIYPGDTVTFTPTFFARMATPIYPLMDNLWLDWFVFFIPNRILWDSWAYFLGEEEEIGDAELPAKYEIPAISSGGSGFARLSVADYFGLPPAIANLRVSALPFRSYAKVWNEWFRDQNLQDRLTERTAGGVLATPGVPGTSPIIDLVTDAPLQARGKRHDYFTSCLPWPQKGATVLLPLGDQAPLVGDAAVIPLGAGVGPTFQQASGGGSNRSLTTTNASTAIAYSGNFTANSTAAWGSTGLLADLQTGVPSAPYADLSAASAATINELRLAFQVQRLLERDARSGSRLVELTQAHFGVHPGDYRLQRPEFLGGGSVPISINPVPQTSGTGADGQDTVQGNLAAYATAAGQGRTVVKSFVEHGILLGLCSVRADLNYQQGIARSWFHRERFDFYWPALQAIGEQAVLSREIYADGTGSEAAGTGDWSVFGYQEAWAHLRYKPSIITGQFRSDHPTPLDSWHLAQDFATRPTLSETFIVDTPPIGRVVAVPSEPEFIMDSYVSMRHVRPMPTFSVPGLIDHF